MTVHAEVRTERACADCEVDVVSNVHGESLRLLDVKGNTSTMFNSQDIPTNLDVDSHTSIARIHVVALLNCELTEQSRLLVDHTILDDQTFNH